MCVRAVLDWELSTLGDPITDVATCLFSHYCSQSTPTLKGVLLSLLRHSLTHVQVYSN